ncbi:MAG: LysR family transcriptional regulator [Rhizobiaceae bacterium]
MTGSYLARGVPVSDNAAFGFDWGDVRLFVLVARAGSLRRASLATGRSIGAIRRRLEYLEQKAGCKLFVTSSSGSHLTPHGEELLRESQPMVDAALRISSGLNLFGGKGRPEVRIAAAEEVGLFWLIPRLPMFQRRHPDLALHLNCVSVPPDVHTLQVDLSMQLQRPEHDDLLVARLGYLHMHEFIAQPLMVAQAQQSSDPSGFRPHGLQATFGQVKENAGLPVKGNATQQQLQTNTMAARYFAIRYGAATGHLPNFAKLFDPSLVATQDAGSERQEIFLTYRREMVEKRSLGIAIEWIRSSINPRAFPWFSSDRIHPNDLESVGESLD